MHTACVTQNKSRRQNMACGFLIYEKIKKKQKISVSNLLQFCLSPNDFLTIKMD